MDSIVIQLWTDSACMHSWISDTLSGKTRVYTKAALEMLIRHWLTTFGELTSCAADSNGLESALKKTSIELVDTLA